MKDSESILVVKLKKSTLYTPLVGCLLGMIFFALTKRWHYVIFFSIFLLYIARELLSDSRTLTLSYGGITMGTKGNARFFKWGDIEGFTLKGPSGLFASKYKRIAFNLISTPIDASLSRRISKKLTGFDYEIGSGYEVGTDELLTLLTTWRNNALPKDSSGIRAAPASIMTSTKTSERGLTIRSKPLQSLMVGGVVIGLIGAIWIITQSKVESVKMRGPDQIAVVSDSVYIHFGNMLYHLSSTGQLLRNIDLASLGIKGYLEDMQILRSGDILIGDSTGRIQMCDIGKMKCRYIGTRSNYTLGSPFKFIPDESGSRLYIVDVDRHKLLTQDLDTGIVTELADGSTLKYPNGVYLGKDGLLYVADTNNHRIVSFIREKSSVRESASFPAGSHVGRSGRTWPVVITQGPTGELWVLNADSALKDADLIVYDIKGNPQRRVPLPEYSDPLDIAWVGERLIYTDFRTLEVNSWQPGTDNIRSFGDKQFKSILRDFVNRKDKYRKRKGSSLATGFALFTAAIVLLIIILQSKMNKHPQDTPKSSGPSPQPHPDYMLGPRLDEIEREMLKKGIRLNWIIWMAMFFSLGVYILGAHILADELIIDIGKDFPLSLVRNVLFVIALAEFAVIYYLRKKMLAKTVSLQSQLYNSQHTDFRFHPANSKYTTALIVSLAIAESMTIYGFILFLLGKDIKSFYALTALSAMAMMIFRPKMEELENLAIELKRGTTMGEKT